jgi:hypothetical protein
LARMRGQSTGRESMAVQVEKQPRAVERRRAH